MARLRPALCLAALTMFSTGALAARSADSAGIKTVGIPAGFSDLAREHEMLVDVWFGGRKVGETRIVASPGHVRFKDPGQLLSLVPQLEVTPELSAALAGELPSNAGLACPPDRTDGCGTLTPDIAGVILDEDRFRLDLFINRKWLRVIKPEQSPYLPVPDAPLSLTSSAGIALSGSTGSSPAYNFQNRTIVGFHNARIRSDSSYSSSFGFLVDTLVGEVDRPGLRYSAGLFWAPGLDLTGQRRIAGVGVATQFDTRADRETLSGTPLVLFLSQPARVDILVDGRLVSSHSYDAGNNLLDTSELPDGSYSIVLRVHDARGGAHEEHRFFAKNAAVAPVSQPIYFAYAGMLANSRPGQPISVVDDLFYEFGTARRINRAVALDLSVIGTRNKPIVEGGAWFLSRFGRMRVAGLVSSKGDRGALLQLASSATGPLSMNFDVRRIWSSDGGPLIPLSTYVDSFDTEPLDQRQIGNGSYTQATGSIGYRFGDAYLAVIGSLRKDEGQPLDYSIGPNLNWPVLNRNGLQVALQADAQFSRTNTGVFVGARLFFNSGRTSVSGTAGRRQISNKGDGGVSGSRLVGDATAHYSTSDEGGTDLSLSGGVTREIDSTIGHADAMLYSRFGSLRGEILHDFEGSNRTQYGLTLQSGAVAAGTQVALGGRQLAQSAVLVSVDGDSNGSQFEVLVDGQVRGRVATGRELPIFLQPYREYSVRLQPVNAASVGFDTAARDVTLYPGNVQAMRWRVGHLLTVFGRAVRPDGTPVSDALVTSKRGIGQSDSNGYFQIEIAAKDSLSFALANGTCAVPVSELDGRKDYASLGKVVCR